jgi:hypothetical protein
MGTWLQQVAMGWLTTGCRLGLPRRVAFAANAGILILGVGGRGRQTRGAGARSTLRNL